MTFAELSAVAQLSLTNPKAGARLVLDLRVSNQVRWLAVVILSILVTLISGAGQFLTGSALPADAPPINYFAMTAVHAVTMILPAALIDAIGQRTGGKAGFADALLIVVWLEALLLPLRVITVALHVIHPDLSQIGLLAIVAATFWLLTNFVAELHGYRSRLNVFLGIMATGVVIGILVLPFLDPNFR